MPKKKPGVIARRKARIRALVQWGHTQAQIARRLCLCPRAVGLWVRRLRRAGA